MTLTMRDFEHLLFLIFVDKNFIQTCVFPFCLSFVIFFLQRYLLSLPLIPININFTRFDKTVLFTISIAIALWGIYNYNDHEEYKYKFVTTFLCMFTVLSYINCKNYI